jgi:hypothetical protein
MSLNEFIWAEIGAGLGVLFCMLLLTYHRRTQLRWYRFLKSRIDAPPTQETDPE